MKLRVHPIYFACESGSDIVGCQERIVILNDGVYPISEAARYVGISPATLRSWFKPRSDRAGKGPVFSSDFPPVDGDFAISFLNLMDAHFAFLFKRFGVAASTIRRAHQKLQVDLGTPHPFSHAELRTDGKRIIREVAGTLDNAFLLDVISHQHFFGEMREQLRKVSYDARTKLAQAWAIADGVELRPGVSFGKPVVQNTGTSTYVLARQYYANDQDAPLVAKLFRLKESDIFNAVHFEDGLVKKRAA